MGHARYRAAGYGRAVRLSGDTPHFAGDASVYEQCRASQKYPSSTKFIFLRSALNSRHFMMEKFDAIEFTSIRAASLRRASYCTGVPELFMQRVVVTSVCLPIETDLHYASGTAQC